MSTPNLDLTPSRFRRIFSILQECRDLVSLVFPQFEDCTASLSTSQLDQFLFESKERLITLEVWENNYYIARSNCGASGNMFVRPAEAFVSLALAMGENPKDIALRLSDVQTQTLPTK